jgi:phosphoribosyl-AMP cyclohydrolase
MTAGIDVTGNGTSAGILDADRLLPAVRFNADGMVAAIAQQHDTGEVLMLAWMNAESLRETLATGRVCYWSRSRSSLWRKGESSGQVQTLRRLRLDCDGDTILLLVEQQGVACHTGRRNCFYRELRPEGLVTIADVVIPPDQLYGIS